MSDDVMLPQPKCPGPDCVRPAEEEAPEAPPAEEGQAAV